MTPINSKFLKSTCTYSAVSGVDTYGKPTYLESVSISRVYIEEKRERSNADLGPESKDIIKLWHDVRRSAPKDQVYSKGDKITYSGRDYEIVSALLLPNSSKAHHWEISAR